MPSGGDAAKDACFNGCEHIEVSPGAMTACTLKRGRLSAAARVGSILQPQRASCEVRRHADARRTDSVALCAAARC